MRRVAKIVTPPTVTPISVAEAKSHMNVTFSTDDTIIGLYIATATALCEAILQRKLITQTWKMWLDYWPDKITVLFGDLQSVTHIKYTDSDETQATLSATLYNVDINSIPGRIILKDGENWPTDTLSEMNPIEIQFVTGYGLAAAVPADIRNAVFLTTAHFYENREIYLISKMQSAGIAEIPLTAKALLSNHRVWDWIA